VKIISLFRVSELGITFDKLCTNLQEARIGVQQRRSLLRESAVGAFFVTVLLHSTLPTNRGESDLVLAIIMSDLSTNVPMRSLFRRMSVMERKVSFRPANSPHSERFLQNYLRYKFHSPSTPKSAAKSRHIAQQYLDYRNALHHYTVRPTLSSVSFHPETPPSLYISKAYLECKWLYHFPLFIS